MLMLPSPFGVRSNTICNNIRVTTENVAGYTGIRFQTIDKYNLLFSTI